MQTKRVKKNRAISEHNVKVPTVTWADDNKCVNLEALKTWGNAKDVFKIIYLR